MKTLLLSAAVCSLVLSSCKTDSKDQKNEQVQTEMNQTTDQKTNKSATALSNTDPELKQIAMASGFDNWKDIKKVDFTFNLDRGEDSHFQRSWEWWPDEDKVKMTSGQDTITYSRKGTMNPDEKKADQAFINDKYWLLFPYQLAWDSGFKKTVNPKVKAPISGNEMKEIEIAYNEKDGYTPGDTYKIYVDKDNMIQEWSYFPKGQKEPKMITTWEDYQKDNGITYAKNHMGKDGQTKLYFSDVNFEK